MSLTPQILLLTHGGWGAQLRESVRMVIGETDGVFDIALMPVDTLDEFYQKVKQQVSVMPAGSVILTDFIGGTTSNVAARLSADYQIGVISGLNATLLLAAIDLRDRGALTDAIDELVELGQKSCIDVVKHIKSITSEE
ncbi:PTS fructose transporter subunit IIA [Limnobaculum zhutongyuii]|uniref:PTS fructose transporter subunit IIA n=1 Tax=Limnobaculum zhutongyuii TaxID=2498113 RepID=A0A411WLA0_9GAMM|nr:PTS fructose transporter subunit IIA [Limnobaculum zhutongyuii]QBH96940.1 PTS fructose transporter subunit IIA [Limnobaculum zhutongyuii]TQS87510.1 PTS fructose transporter subunit IIA [Limnobaculum zhutongyuii]